MIVYVDILIVLNLIVDYFLLLAVGAIIRRKAKFWRLLAASIEGSIFSLYIFLPQSPLFTEIAVRVLFCIIMAGSAFGFISFKEFLRAAGAFFAVSCLYAGIMMSVWKLFSPRGMVVNNSVVYFDISALALICFTVAFYFLFMVLSKIFASNGTVAKSCRVHLEADGQKTEFTAMLDTGNSLDDIFGSGEIIIADKRVAESLFTVTDIDENPALKSRYRAVPLSTVAGDDMLDGFRCDIGYALLGKETVNIKNPIIAISKTPLDSGYDGIVNPKIFRNAVEENVSNNQKVFK